MADEISVTLGLQAIKGEISIRRDVVQITPDMAGDCAAIMSQSVPTTAAGTAITLPATLAITTLGWCRFKHLGTVNYVELGIQTGGVFFPFAKLLPGEVAIMRLALSITPFARSNTAPVLLESMFVEL